ncbi:tetrafunctional fatty acid synthase subunit FAS1 [Ascoidea rubescens DSM 1968]|uniref:Fatty acid synthase subunit beta n=1 Tax=Ascoidea rubescens DSM 1968 TaxID=1344418 RepID=A0A1D2V996_9ASCO|nr:beta subunit of fatty acid synthase [Ascoidea rubescens DSM 1968]ODV58075.1 beta subunit of fatty acid synthase [Ascoidea rubescens DSM 1968]
MSSHHQLSMRPTTISHGSLEHTLLIPTSIYFATSQLKQQFLKNLPDPTEGFASPDEPSSPSELLAKFLGYAATFVDPLSPGPFDDVLNLSLNEFESRYLQNNKLDLHTFAASLLTDEKFPTSIDKVKHLIKNYYIAKSVSINDSSSSASISPPKKSALLSNPNAIIYAVFGGQGNTDNYFEELRDLYNIYQPLIKDFINKMDQTLKDLVLKTEGSEKVFSQGLDIKTWLSSREKTPDSDYLLLTPVSSPIIGIIQIAHYALACKILNLSPGQLRHHLKGATGHSQGLAAAVALAASDSWDSFYENSIKAISLLFFIGVRCLQVYPNTSLPPSVFSDSIENGEGKPSPMLSIRDLSLEQVQDFVNKTNTHLPKEKKLVISLINGARNLVVSGPPQALCGLNLALRKAKAPAGLDQARIPYSERKLKFSSRFLPITSPYHSPLLDPALDTIVQDLESNSIEFIPSTLQIPVFDSYKGQNLAEFSSGSLAKHVVMSIITYQVNWEKATNFKSTHILDFGPGGLSGLGVLTHRNKEGTGSRIILAGAFDIPNSDDEFGFKQELFDSNQESVYWASNWFAEFKPRLIKTVSGQTYVDTKFSRLLGRAPLMIPGMTPSTVSSDFVATILNSGYHAEIAGGGYFTAPMMTKALETVTQKITPGYGIGINLIYVNPRMLQWGIPMIKELREKGLPIQSLSIGAGVPSLDVASEYIETLGLTHLGLKPGSIESIAQCITIAKAHPDFPIVLQWTGGRAGGHHSFEDFHQPILQMYAKIRKCSNIILVAGSGFGSDKETYPYLTGEWSTKFNYPPMPFDGFLFGSRVMIAKEAKTSPKAKEAIANCSGVSDESWEQTYKRPTGGIVTVRSEMGEPIHKIATRGVLLWKEFDEKYFKLPKNKLLDALNKNKDNIIKRLNSDFQKPWFGKNVFGSCDIEDMTYGELILRLIELMFVRSSNRWIDISLRNFTGRLIRRIEERFIKSKSFSVLQTFEELDNPDEVYQNLIHTYSDIEDQLVNQEDCDYFLLECQNPAQKPVPFVPVLDERFEFFFKKDSLWQSEDLEAVVDQDVQRTCILHGPVAAQYSNVVDEPVKDILDGIHNGHIERLLEDYYDGDDENIPIVEYFGNVSFQKAPKEVEHVTTTIDDDTVTYTIGSKHLPKKKEWLDLLAGSELSWLHAFISSDRIVQNSNFVANPTHKVLAPAKNISVEITNISTPEQSVLTFYEKLQGKLRPVVEIELKSDLETIALKLIEHRNFDKQPLPLELLYTFDRSDGFALIKENMVGRNDRIKQFYWKLWFGIEEPQTEIDVQSLITGDEVTITTRAIAEFTHAIGNNCESYVERSGKETLAPMDFAIVVGWKAIMKAIFPKVIDGDLLRLVHLSNGFKMIPGASPLKLGDTVTTYAEIKAVTNKPSGKQVRVVGIILRDGEEVMEVTSEFFYRGEYDDYENTFEKIEETPMQIHFSSLKNVAVLISKEWVHLEDPNIDLLDQTLTFRCNTEVTYKSKNVFSSVQTTGQILLELPTKEIKEIGVIEYEAAESYGNPVMDYLTRNGNTIEQPVLFDNSIPLSSGIELIEKTPDTNEGYAAVSGDYNPIHVSRVFSEYAGLPGTITHGMYTSAIVRALVETWAADNAAPTVRAYSCKFVGMILPNSNLETSLDMIGMINGRKIIKVETKNVDTGSVVLTGEAEIEQPSSAYVFTGQGSQEQNMGMDLYNKSKVAKEVWDRADKHFLNSYGFSILDIVKNNPNEMTIYFGGAEGRKIRQNYMSMMFETIDEDGNLKSEKIFKDIVKETNSFTFKSPTGLLSATQFTQPALTLMEKASFEDLKSKGLVPQDCMFAGHSLGEYSALASLGDVMPIESLVEVVFYRGMTMQVAVPRDEKGRSNYGMIAVNPSRVSTTFTDAALRFVVEHIAKQTQWLLEIVNYNVENQQYVAAGDLRGLDALTNVLNVFKLQKIDIEKLQEIMSLEEVAGHLSEIVEEVSKKTLEKPQPISLERGFACIPLKGISVPFHSSYLRSGVKPFQRFLEKKVPKSAIKPTNLIGKYIPNLTAKPFEITKEYFEEVYELTRSEKIRSIIANWESYETE